MATWLTYPGLSRQEFANPTSLAWKQQPSKIVLHSTEGSGYPSAKTYRDGRSAPHFTTDLRGRTARQHYPLTEAAWALRAPAGVSTNTLGAIQIEIIGTCVESRRDEPHSVLTFDDGDLGYLAGLLEVIAAATDIPLVTNVPWLSYPASYGDSPVRLSVPAWTAYRGVLGHQHVPGNTHGDPGALNVARALELVGATPVSAPPAPVPKPKPPREYAMDRLDLRNAHVSPVKGRHVDNLQGLLLAAGYGPSGLVGANGRPDGIAGRATQGAVGDWQRRTNTGDGRGNADYIVGDGTWKSLIEF